MPIIMMGIRFVGSRKERCARKSRPAYFVGGAYYSTVYGLKRLSSAGLGMAGLV